MIAPHHRYLKSECFPRGANSDFPPCFVETRTVDEEEAADPVMTLERVAVEATCQRLDGRSLALEEEE
ncbi:unnamed protein product [Linum trigynum]|uniref:Uncharacterized protein n=1 Tax=Linum trigynum TaxID=586398 RepID=A0AAV2DXL0_9ROSI